MWGVFCGRVNKCQGICQHPLVVNDKSQLSSQEHKQNGKCIGSHDEEECETQISNQRTCPFVASCLHCFHEQDLLVQSMGATFSPFLVLGLSYPCQYRGEKICSLMGNRKLVWPFQEPIQLKRCSAQRVEGKAMVHCSHPTPAHMLAPQSLNKDNLNPK